MNWKKGCLIAAGASLALAVVIGVVVVIAFTLTGGAVDSANQFLSLLGEGKVSEAYQATAPAFQKQTEEGEFQEMVDQLGLAEYQSASWSSRKVEKGEADLEGTVKTKSGDEIPLTMKLVKVGEEWKVFSLSGPQAGVKVAKPGEEEAEEEKPEEEKPKKGKVPSEAEAKKLALDTLLAFNQAVQAKDFQSFYKTISKTWKKQTTAAEIQKEFQVFIDKEVDISEIQSEEPVFKRKPALDEDGLLVFSGYYPTRPLEVHFDLKFIRESGVWKLFGIEVQAKPPSEKSAKPGKKEAVPSEKEAKEMALQALLDLNQAIQAQDFKIFYKKISKVWQKQVTPAKLQEAFQGFIDQEIDLSPIQKVSCVLENPPALAEDGTLTFSGYFSTKPNRVYFDLTYVQEKAQWKLLGISVNIK